MSMFSRESLRLGAKMGLSWVMYAGTTHWILSSECLNHASLMLCDAMSLRCEAHALEGGGGATKTASVARILALLSTYTVWVVHSAVTGR